MYIEIIYHQIWNRYIQNLQFNGNYTSHKNNCRALGMNLGFKYNQNSNLACVKIEYNIETAL